MTLLDTVVSGGRRRLNAVVETPGRLLASLRFKRTQIQRGEITPREIGLTAVGSVAGLLVTAALMFPVYWIVLAALKGPGAALYATSGAQLLPTNPEFDSFAWVLGDIIVPRFYIGVDAIGYIATPEIELLDASDYGIENPSDFKTYFWNSLTIAIPTVILGMILVIPGAYALSRREFIGRRKVLYVYILFTQIGGGIGIATLIALYAMFVQFGLDDNKLVLAVYYAATGVPFNTWLLKTYLDGIPTSYEEAAAIDGASSWQIVYEVILPLAKPGLVTIFIFMFLIGWTEFVIAQTLLTSDNYTLAVGIFTLLGQYTIPWSHFAAFAVVFALPITFIYMYGQRYMESGLTIGT
jgi:arabinogalactan oligomer/maltooligosaccharide transport system permease protein